MDLERPGTGGTNAAWIFGDTPVATDPPGGGGGGGGGGAPPLLLLLLLFELNDGMEGDFPGIGGGALKFLGNVL